MPTVVIIILAAACAFCISLAVSYTLTKRTLAKNPVELAQLAKDVIKEYGKYTYVISGHTPAIEKQEAKNDEPEDKNFYLVGFGNDELALCRFEVVGGSFKLETPVIYNKDNLSKIEVRYMRTNARLYDKSNNFVGELTVPQLTSKEIYEEFPLNVNQNDDALKFYDFIENLSAQLEKI